MDSFLLLALLMLLQPPPAVVGGEQAPVMSRFPDRVAVARMNPVTRRATGIRRDLIATHFADGTPVREVRVDRHDRRYFLVLSGGPPGACRTTRVELERTGATLALRPRGATQTCSGNPCSRCGFVEPAGCSCNDGSAGGHCNHTISSGAAFSMLRGGVLSRE